MKDFGSTCLQPPCNKTFLDLIPDASYPKQQRSRTVWVR